MRFKGFIVDENDLLAIGIPQEDINAEKEAHARFNAAVDDMFNTDWAEEIKAKNRWKATIIKAIDKVKEQLNGKTLPATKTKSGLYRPAVKIAGYKDDLEKITTEYRTIYISILQRIHVPDNQEEWDMFLTKLRAMKRTLKQTTETIQTLEKQISDMKTELKNVESWIDWAKFEKAAVGRCKKWASMSASGCSLGDTIAATKPPKSKSGVR